MLIDHQDNKIEIPLKPGEMILYESAKVLHGRMKPFKGRFYDNVFVHFKPSRIWYDKEFNMHDPPEILLTKKDLI